MNKCYYLQPWGYTSLEVKVWWGLFLPSCLITAVQQPGTSVLHLCSSAVIWTCAGALSPISPVLCQAQSSLTFDLQWHVSLYSSDWLSIVVFVHTCLLLPETLSPNVGKLFSKLKLVANRKPPFIYAGANREATAWFYRLTVPHLMEMSQYFNTSL